MTSDAPVSAVSTATRGPYFVMVAGQPKKADGHVYVFGDGCNLFVHAENRCIVDEEWLGLPTKQEQFAHGVMDRLAALERSHG